MTLKPQDKLLLTIADAAAYSSIGCNKLREIINDNPLLNWVIRIGEHTKIKRPLFEKWLDDIKEI